MECHWLRENVAYIFRNTQKSQGIRQQFSVPEKRHILSPLLSVLSSNLAKLGFIGQTQGLMASRIYEVRVMSNDTQLGHLAHQQLHTDQSPSAFPAVNTVGFPISGMVNLGTQSVFLNVLVSCSFLFPLFALLAFFLTEGFCVSSCREVSLGKLLNVLLANKCGITTWFVWRFLLGTVFSFVVTSVIRVMKRLPTPPCSLDFISTWVMTLFWTLSTKPFISLRRQPPHFTPMLETMATLTLKQQSVQQRSQK